MNGSSAQHLLWVTMVAATIAVSWSGDALSEEAAPSPSAAEPAISDYVIEIDGQATPVRINQLVTIQIDGKPYEFRLAVPEIKHFSLPILSFEYPGHFRFESDDSDSETNKWTVRGDDFKIQILRFPKSKSFEELTQTLTEGLPGKFPSGRTTESVCELALAGTKVFGVQFDVELMNGELHVQYSFFDLRLSDDKYRYILVLFDSSKVVGRRSREGEGAVEILTTSFKFHDESKTVE